MIFAYGVAVARALLSVVFSIGMLAAPESMMPGSSTEPAHTLLVFFASRLLALSAGFLVLTFTGQRRALAGLMLFDCALQIFDMAWPATHGQVSAGLWVPVVIFAAELWAAWRLSRSDQRAALYSGSAAGAG
jgi:hypothetical protein